MPRIRHSTIVLALLTIGIIVAGAVFFKVSLPNLQFRELPNHTNEPLPAPKTATPNLREKFLCNNSATAWHSLITIANQQLALARTISADADPFEVHAEVAMKDNSPLSQLGVDLRFVTTDFELPTNDARYLSVEAAKYADYTVNQDLLKRDELQIVCAMKLDNFVTPTEQLPILPQEQGGINVPESSGQHLAIRNWRIDVDEIARLLKDTVPVRAEFYPGLRLTVTSIGRARDSKFFMSSTAAPSDFFASLILSNAQLSRLPDSQAIIEVTMPEQGAFWLLDAQNGEVLASGGGLYPSYLSFPPMKTNPRPNPS